MSKDPLNWTKPREITYTAEFVLEALQWMLNQLVDKKPKNW